MQSNPVRGKNPNFKVEKDWASADKIAKGENKRVNGMVVRLGDPRGMQSGIMISGIVAFQKNPNTN